MDIDFSKFKAKVQSMIKDALSDNKIDAQEIRDMKLDKKTAIELMKQLSGNPQFIGDGFVRVENRYTRLISLDKVENDTIIPLNEKAQEHYLKNYPDKDIKDGYYKDGKLFLLDSNGNLVKDDSGNYITEEIIIKEPDKKVPNFINRDGTLNIKEFQNYLNNLPESNEDYISLMKDLEDATKESSYWSIEKFAGTQKERFLKIYQAIENHDLEQAVELMYSYFQEECRGFDKNVLSVVRSGLERLTGAKWAGPALYNALSYIAEHADNLMGRDENGIGYAERFVIGLDNTGKGLGDFVFSSEGLITMGAIASGEALLAKASSTLAPYVGAAIHSFFAAQGMELIADGTIKVATGETLGEIAQGGQEIGHGLPLAITPVVRAVDASIKISENISRIKDAKGLKELDDVLTDIFTKPMTPEERLNYSRESMQKRIELEKNKSENELESDDTKFPYIAKIQSEIKNFLESEEYKKIVTEYDEITEDLPPRVKDLATKNVKDEVRFKADPFSVAAEKNTAIQYIKYYKNLKEQLSKVKDKKLRQELETDLENRLNADNKMSLIRRLDLFSIIFKFKTGAATLSEAVFSVIAIKYPNIYHQIKKPYKYIENPEYKELVTDIVKCDALEKFKDLLIKNKNNPYFSIRIYEEYLDNEMIPSIAIKDLCLKINREFGVKVLLPSNMSEAEVALKALYQHLSKLKIAAETNSERLKLPDVINFSTASIKFYDNENNSGTKRINNAFYDEKENVMHIRGLTQDIVNRFFKHEFLHANTPRLTAFPKDFEPTDYIYDLIDAGLEEGEILNAIRNPSEFAITTLDGDVSKYSDEFKSELLKFGLPDWAFKYVSNEQHAPKLSQVVRDNRYIKIMNEYLKNRDNLPDNTLYSSKTKESPEARLKAFTNFVNKIEQSLTKLQIFSKNEIAQILDNSRNIINDFLYLNEYVEEETEYLTNFMNNIKMLKFFGFDIVKCKDIKTAMNANEDLSLSYYSFETVSKHTDPKIQKIILDYLQDPSNAKDFDKIFSLHMLFEENFELVTKYPDLFPKLIAEVADGQGKTKIITIEDLFNINNGTKLSEEKLQFFNKKGSKSLQELLNDGGEFEKLDNIAFSSTGNNLKKTVTIIFNMKEETTYPKAWKAIEYTFKNFFNIQKSKPSSHTISKELSNDKKWCYKDNAGVIIPKTIRSIYEFIPKYQAIIDNLVLDDNLWNINGLTFITEVSERCAFLEKFILKGNISNKTKLENSSFVKSEIANSAGIYLSKEMNRNDRWIKNGKPMALRELYDSYPQYRSIIKKLVFDNQLWEVNGITFFNSIHSRCRFLERIILNGTGSSYNARNPLSNNPINIYDATRGAINMQKIRNEIENITNIVQKDITTKAVIEKYHFGDNPNIHIKYNKNGKEVEYKIGLDLDGTCTTIMD